MIVRAGWAALGAAGFAILVAFVALNPLLFVLGVGTFAFLATEIIRFERLAANLGPEKFVVLREEEFPRVPRGSDAVTTVRIDYHGARAFLAEFVDVIPESFRLRLGERALSTLVTPGSSWTMAYAYQPQWRGSFILGPTILSARDSLGLCRTTLILPSAGPLVVLPDVFATRPAALARAVRSPISGPKVVRYLGAGTEFRALREYQPEDDIRHVAWKRSTSDRWYVRDFERESRQDFIAVLDLSPPMRAGQVGATALDRAVEATSVLVRAIARQAEDRYGLATYSGRLFQFLPPGRGPRHFKWVTDNLALAAERDAPFRLADALAETARHLRRHTHLFVFSALAGSLDGLGGARERLRARGHRAYVFAPDLTRFYPELSDPVGQKVVGWAKDTAERRQEEAWKEVRRLGLPLMTYDCAGASDLLGGLYLRLRSWQGAR